VRGCQPFLETHARRALPTQLQQVSNFTHMSEDVPYLDSSWRKSPGWCTFVYVLTAGFEAASDLTPPLLPFS
jgi:hypothetical protein